MTELEERWRDLGEFIREQRNVGQLSLRKLSEMAGISNPYLSQIERGLRKPSAEILRQIAQALHISAETLYVRAGILEERDGSIDLVAEIRRDPLLSEEQKKTLVHIYESFRAEQRAMLDDKLAVLDVGELHALIADEADEPAADSVADDGPAPEPDEPAAGPTPDPTLDPAPDPAPAAASGAVAEGEPTLAR